MEAETLQKWVIGLVILIVLVFAVYAISRNVLPSDRFQSAVNCRASVELLDKEQRSFFGVVTDPSAVPFNCETVYVENITLEKEKPEERKEEFLDEVVPLMRDCWYQFGEGKLDPFRASFHSVERICFVCSRFIIPIGFSQEVSKDDLTKYFVSHKDGLSKKRYDEFFSSAFPLNSPFLKEVDTSVLFWTLYLGADFEPVDSISRKVSSDYAVVLYGIQPDLLDKAAGTLVGAESFGQGNYVTFVVPYNSTKDLDCTELKKKPRTG